MSADEDQWAALTPEERAREWYRRDAQTRVVGAPGPPGNTGGKPRIWPTIVFAALVGLAVGYAAGATGNGTSSSSASARAAAPATVTVRVPVPTLVPAPTPPPPPGPRTTFGDGVWLVGVDITPGTYVAPGGRNCYWERAKDASGTWDSRIANDWRPGQGQSVANANAGEYLKVSGCGQWKAR